MHCGSWTNGILIAPVDLVKYTMVIKRSLQIYRDDGLFRLCREGISRIQRSIRRSYAKYIRSRTSISDERVEYNDITVLPYRYTDRYFPLALPPNQGGHEYPEAYEQSLIDALRRSVAPGDDVTIIGGGLGVTSVIASQEAGTGGSVTVYEGSGTMLPHLRATLKLNETPAEVKVIHGIVGSANQLDGHAMGASIIGAGSLDECDVLEMDCEGAEVDILGTLSSKPERIIVETHGNKDSVINLLESLNYAVQNAELAERGPYESVCRQNGIEVITAV